MGVVADIDPQGPSPGDEREQESPGEGRFWARGCLVVVVVLIFVVVVLPPLIWALGIAAGSK